MTSGRLAVVSVAAALALGACGGCHGSRSREPLANSLAAYVEPRWRVERAAPPPSREAQGWPITYLDDGSMLHVNEESAILSRDDAESPRWVVDWHFKVRIEDVAAAGDAVWALVHSVRGASPVLAGTTIAHSSNDGIAAVVRIDAETGSVRGAQVLTSAPGLSLPIRLAVGTDALVASASSTRGGLWRIDPKTLATTAMARSSYDLFFESIDVVSPGLTCAHISDPDELRAAYVCFDAALREHSRVPLPSRPQHLWTGDGTVAGTVSGDNDLDLEIELAGLPALKVSGVCRVSEERGIGLWTWLALHDKDGDDPMVERCESPWVHALDTARLPTGDRLLLFGAKSSVRVAELEIPIEEETVVSVSLGSDLRAQVAVWPGCKNARVLSNRWLRINCRDGDRLVDLRE